MSRRLVVLRHAKSEWPDGVVDHQRPLSARGRREAPVAGRWLNEHIGTIDVAVISPARRAQETWARVAAELDGPPEPRVENRLYPGSVTDLLTLVRELDDEARTVLVIGHNPGLEDLVSELSRTECLLKTSSIAVLSVPDDWAGLRPGSAALETVATPRP
jgi:phosphohistidine phosphatase